MTFFFGLLDLVLTTIMLFDTLGLAYQFRKEGKSDPKEYVRVCLSWIFFLTICNLFSCNKKGFFGTIIRLIIFGAKAFFALPILGGTLKAYKFLIEDGNAEKYYQKVEQLVKSKLCHGGCPSSISSDPTVNNINEPTTQQ